MKIYTKFGDKGQSQLFSGKKVPKDHPLLHCYGSVDELSALLGLICAQDPQTSATLMPLQNELFQLCSDLATPLGSKASKHIKRMDALHIERLEKDIDQMEKNLQPLKTFILPGGSITAAQLHLCRTVCRRAERYASEMIRKKKLNLYAGIYLNRLSDWFFVYARWTNKQKKIPDVLYTSNA